VLVVEDDSDIAQMVELYLRDAGYHTERAGDGVRALELWRAAAPDLILLDIGLPKLDGLEVLKRVRVDTTRPQVPVILLTARAEEVDELIGLGLGADDYVTKPFSPRTLLARVQAMLRRHNSVPDGAEQLLRVGELVVDDYRVQVTYQSRPVPLTLSEFKILRHLAVTPGRAITRSELFEEAMPESDALERVVDVHMKNLRHKLAEQGATDIIATVRGVGYRLVER
jgi:two-component system response regulator AdeR